MLAKGVFSVSQSPADLDLLILKKNNVAVAGKELRISAIRAYLIGQGTAQYTLNAAVRIANFVSKQLALNYQVSTNLSGTAADDKLIIPDNITLGVVLLQAYNGLTVDGMPGADFIRKIMGLHKDITIGAQCRAVFMDESNNTNSVTAYGLSIVMPDFLSGETVIYDFLRNITIVRNGLWSDKADIINFVALRLERGSTNIQWDDTITACWIDAKGQKNAKVYTATTEPGNRKMFKTLLPQTILFIPGYHQGKMPALRGHRMVTFVPTNKYPDRFLYNINDERGLNMHPGGTTGAMKNLVQYILPIRAENEAEFKAVLVFMDVFEIISRWGLDPARSAWDNLSGWAAKKALRAGAVKNGQVPVYQDEKTQAVKQISVATARGWLAKKWANDKAVLVQILSSVDRTFNAPKNLKTLKINGLENIITDAHIQGIVSLQCDYFFDLKDVDGLAGPAFVALLDADVSADGALAQLANTDFARLNDLLKQFDGSNPVLTTARKNYVKQIKTQTLQERKKLLESEAKIVAQALTQSSNDAVNELVGTWSILCQVVFGPEMFYQMMEYALGKALQTGQRRWYYTLIDQATVPKQAAFV